MNIETGTTTSVPQKKFSIQNIKIKNIRSYAMVITLIGIWVLFAFTTDGTFISLRNISNLARQMSVTGILATGMIVCLLAGSFDLSVGSTVALSGSVAALAHSIYGVNPILAMFLALLVGLGAGVFQGYWIAKRAVPAFVVTLGGQMIFRGITLIICSGRSIPIQNKTFLTIGQAYLPTYVGYILAVIFAVVIGVVGLHKRKSRKSYNLKVAALPIDILKYAAALLLIGLFIGLMNGYEGLPVEVLILISAITLAAFVLKRTKFGRHIYATGGNENAARISGINVNSIFFKVFVINSVMAALAGLILTARLASATPMAGNGFELDAISSCVIGGVSLSGGRGSIFGALIGALVMASLNNGMSLMNIPSAYQYVIKGLIFIVAVWLDVASKKKGN